jgi:hypothetical protein
MVKMDVNARLGITNVYIKKIASLKGEYRKMALWL